MSRQASEATENTEDTVAQDFDDSCIAVAVPCVAFLGFSAHPREAENDSFLGYAAKINQRLAAARARPCTPSLSSVIVVVSRVLREIDAALFRSEKNNNHT